MTDEQLSKIIGAMGNQGGSKEIIDNLSKIGVALCVAGIMWVGSQIQALDRKMIEMDGNQKTLRAQVESFSKEPRFTSEMNKASEAALKAEMDVQILRMLNAIDGNAKLLSDRSTFMKDTENSLDEIDDRLRKLERN